MIWWSIKGVQESQQEKRFSPPRLLSPTPVLRAGETARLTFERLPRAGKLLPHDVELHARLVQLEVTERTQGTDTVYDYHVLYEEPLSSHSFSAGQSELRASWSVPVPTTARPYMESPKHWVFWQLQVLQEVPKQEPWLSEFILPIG